MDQHQALYEARIHEIKASIRNLGMQFVDSLQESIVII